MKRAGGKFSTPIPVPTTLSSSFPFQSSFFTPVPLLRVFSLSSNLPQQHPKSNSPPSKINVHLVSPFFMILHLFTAGAVIWRIGVSSSHWEGTKVSIHVHSPNSSHPLLEDLLDHDTLDSTLQGPREKKKLKLYHWNIIFPGPPFLLLIFHPPAPPFTYLMALP